MSASTNNSSRPNTDEDSLTFNPSGEGRTKNENRAFTSTTMTSKTIVEKRNWKDRYYSEVAAQELELIVWKAESIEDSCQIDENCIGDYQM